MSISRIIHDVYLQGAQLIRGTYAHVERVPYAARVD